MWPFTASLSASAQLKPPPALGEGRTMTVKREHRELVEALATGEHAKARQLNEAISGEDRHGYNNYLGAVFAVLVDDHFKDNLSRDSIAKFVSRLRSEYQRAEHPINGLMIE